MVLIYREVPWEWNCMKWGFTCTMHLQGKLPCRCIWMRGLGTSVKPIGQQVTAALLVGSSSHSQRSPAARNLRLCCSHTLKFLLSWTSWGRQAKHFTSWVRETLTPCPPHRHHSLPLKHPTAAAPQEYREQKVNGHNLTTPWIYTRSLDYPRNAGTTKV